jgi:GAF domain-containing protein
MALPLSAPGETLGVLNVYSLRRGGLTAESERLGTLLASHTAAAFAAARVEENLRTAVAGPCAVPGGARTSPRRGARRRPDRRATARTVRKVVPPGSRA